MNKKTKEKIMFYIPIILIIVFFIGKLIYGLVSPMKVYREKHSVSIGDGIGKVESLLGKPKRIDKTLYGETWGIFYDESFSEYVQIQSKAKIITGIQTTSDKWIFPDGLKVGKKLKEDRKKLNSKYRSKGFELTVLLEDDRETISFVGVQKRKPKVFKSKNKINDETLAIQEQQIIDFLNSKQAKLGRPLFERNEVLDEIAKDNSLYMMQNDGKHLTNDAKTNLFTKRTDGLNMAKGLAQEFDTLDRPEVLVNQLYNSLNSDKILAVRNYNYVGISVLTDENGKKLWTTCQLAEKAN